MSKYTKDQLVAWQEQLTLLTKKHGKKHPQFWVWQRKLFNIGRELARMDIEQHNKSQEFLEVVKQELF